MPGLTLGDTVLDLAVETTHGKMKLHDFVGDSWTILFSHPGDFTPVCTTELGKMAAYWPEFERRGVKLLGPSAKGLRHGETTDQESHWYSNELYGILRDPYVFSGGVMKNVRLRPASAHM